jgi:probable HAF family extracellular repeat protein
MTDLGSLPGYGCSFAAFINSSGQIVGGSYACDGSTNTATLWQDGTSVDLNSLIPPNSTLHLDVALDINDRGEIAVNGSDANGNTHAVLLIPCDENHSGVEGCDYSMVDPSAASKTDPVHAARPSSAVFGNSRMPIGLRDRLRGPMVRRPNRFGSSAPE